MTSYHGGKQRLGLAIARAIAEEVRVQSAARGLAIRGYCEPFCGMMGVFRHVPRILGLSGLRYVGGDANPAVVAMWEAAMDGWSPPSQCTKKEYEACRRLPEASALRGYIGHQFSFGGQFFKGFSCMYGKPERQPRAAARVRLIADVLKGARVKLSAGSYEQFSRLRGYVIYCDPPYGGTTHYVDAPDPHRFWKWCRRMADDNIVLVSGYTAPPDFRRVMDRHHSAHSRGRVARGRERLFVAPTRDSGGAPIEPAVSSGGSRSRRRSRPLRGAAPSGRSP